ncbi:hypothetical protein FDP41_009073 [Naegleria fowleri]|uniref:Peptide deformylase n=1 Tax=Naegleria fowleri TaxID=5763 RepID=A0A6A5BFL4_NAEFO|nr:uncharacterized protein FDP41_009073 [Naegleria fowleri]KAF0972824.1 hypothetical protein FDP41_009073 [Naegleria fowleri]CAG4718745.1 unnamed protein product [Naegleria fowleri]
MLSFLDRSGFFHNKAIFETLLTKHGIKASRITSMINAENTAEGKDKILPFRKVRIAGKKEAILKQKCTESLFLNKNFVPNDNSVLLPNSLNNLKLNGIEGPDASSYYDINQIWTDKNNHASKHTLSDDELQYIFKQVNSVISENQLIFFRDLLMSLKYYYDDGTGISAPQLFHKARYFIGTDRMFKVPAQVKVINAKQSGGFEAKEPTQKSIEDSYVYDIDLELYIEPKLIDKSLETEREVEGCLSFKNEYLFLLRSKEIEIEYINIFGERKRKTLEGFAARVFQHEYDHLDGINMFERIIDKKKDKYVYGEDIYNYLDEMGNLREEFK